MIKINPFSSHVLQRSPLLFKLLLSIILFLVFFGWLIHLIEPENFPSIFEGIWWAIVTTSTVGYGDLVPLTKLGRMIGMLLILSGVGVITSYFAYIAKMSISSDQQFLTGRKEFSGSGHFIIIGWNGRSKRIINNIHESKHHQPIVLIDDTLNKHPLPRANIHFVQGKASLDSVLLQANIKQAERVLITADLQQNELQTDMFSVLTLLAVKGLNPHVYCLVEILTPEQKENALRAGADGIIETNKFASDYMQECLWRGIDEKTKESPTKENGLKIERIPVEFEWKGKTFKQLSVTLLEQDILLVGIVSGGETLIKPPSDAIIHPNDTLLIIGG
ncbi:potassium channel family protein [Peribacillus sp. NPDC097675]|uniref:potassium channel family protein n=1 Tax=Peribacillus sp. NPDC097675 TaxID=3390618 RepID=UPI003CFFD8E0